MHWKGQGGLTRLSHTQFICQIPQIVQTAIPHLMGVCHPQPGSTDSCLPCHYLDLRSSGSEPLRLHGAGEQEVVSSLSEGRCKSSVMGPAPGLEGVTGSLQLPGADAGSVPAFSPAVSAGWRRASPEPPGMGARTLFPPNFCRVLRTALHLLAAEARCLMPLRSTP